MTEKQIRFWIALVAGLAWPGLVILKHISIGWLGYSGTAAAPDIDPMIAGVKYILFSSGLWHALAYQPKNENPTEAPAAPAQSLNKEQTS